MSKQISKLKGMIGLEIHAYPVTREKLFCLCSAKRGKGLKANSYICPICTGQPGAKPMLVNNAAVEKTILIGLMLGCKIEKNWKWQRKHYDWPDMPKGFQNTISGGLSKSVGNDGEFHGIRISSMHLEEDPAAWDPETGGIDYNRSGLPLIEIITAPDFTSSLEVIGWLGKLIQGLSYLKIIDKDAGIKVDVNVSIPGKSERTEIKNINSVENIGKAIDYELERQGREGGKIKETRRFDSVSGKTSVMRIKEDQDDYRFITDPDLKDVALSAKFVSDLKKKIPESPEEKLERLRKKYKIDNYNAKILSKNIDLVEFFESVIGRTRVKKEKVISWVTGELLRHLNYNKTSLDSLDIKAEHFVSLIDLVDSGKITDQQGKKILDKFIPESFDPKKEIKGNEKISGEKELKEFVEKVIKKNGKAVSDFKEGEEKALHFLIGQVMALTKGRADNVVVKELLEKELKD